MDKIRIGLTLLLAVALCSQIFVGSGRADMPIGQSTDRGVTTTRFNRFSTVTETKIRSNEERAVHLSGNETINGRKSFTQPVGGGAVSQVTAGGATVNVGNGNTLAVATTGGATASIANVSGVPTLTINASNAAAVTSVSSANSDIGVAGTTEPVLTLNSGSGAGQIVKRDGSGKIPEVGVANGIAQLDSSGKLSASELPGSVLGAVIYQGVWDASTNTPTLSSGTCTQGYYRKISVPGTTTINGISEWGLNDWIICNGSNYDKVSNAADTVVSVAASAPLVSSGGMYPTVSIPPATDTHDGYTTASDHALWGAKQDALVAGTDYLSPFGNGSTLYGITAAQVGAVPSVRAITAGTGLTGGGDLNADVTLALKITDSTSTADSTTAASATAIKAVYDLVTSKGSGTVTGVTATGPVVSSGGTAPVISIPAATDSNDGYTTAADHAAWAAKQNALVSGSTLKTVGGSTLLGAGDVPAIITLNSATPTTFGNGSILSSNGATLVPAGVTGTGNVVLATGATVTGQKETEVAAGTCSSGYNINPANGTIINLTLSGACSIGVSSLQTGQSFFLVLTQGSTTAPTFSSAFKWLGGAPTWSTSATRRDAAACVSPDGSILICAGATDAH